MSDDQRLDMRFDSKNKDVPTALDVINTTPEFELA